MTTLIPFLAQFLETICNVNAQFCLTQSHNSNPVQQYSNLVDYFTYVISTKAHCNLAKLLFNPIICKIIYIVKLYILADNKF